jgi:sulfite oxidase
METSNRPDEWKIEQGLSGGKLPILDQTGRETIALHPQKWAGIVKDEEAIKAVGDPNELFQRELEGWKGYVVSYFLRRDFNVC